MEKHCSTDVNISLNGSTCSKYGSEVKTKYDTILVPFYENDVLINVDCCPKRCWNNTSRYQKKETNPVNQYREKEKTRRPTYLEIFRKQLASNYADKKIDDKEINALSPYFYEKKNAEKENSLTNFINHELSIDTYYKKIINGDIQMYKDKSYDEDFEFVSNSQHQSLINLREILDASVSRRQSTRTMIEPYVEQFKSPYNRTKSLQRQSEKVRMANRLKMYRKSVQDDFDNKMSAGVPVKQRNLNRKSKSPHHSHVTPSVISTTQNKKANPIKNTGQKSKSSIKSDEAQQVLKINGNQNPITESGITLRKANEVNECNKCNSDKLNLKAQLGCGSKKNAIKVPLMSSPSLQVCFMLNFWTEPRSITKRLLDKGCLMLPSN